MQMTKSRPPFEDRLWLENSSQAAKYFTPLCMSARQTGSEKFLATALAIAEGGSKLSEHISEQAGPPVGDCAGSRRLRRESARRWGVHFSKLLHVVLHPRC